MSVKIRPYTKRSKKGWEVDIVLKMPNGEVHRERVKSPVTSKSGSKFWGEQREAELLKHGVLEAEPEAPTFGDFFERYMKGQALANRQKPSSIDSKERIWKNYLAAPFGKMKLNELTVEHIQAFKGDHPHLSPKTVNNGLSLVNVMLKTALEWGVISAMPVRIRLLQSKGDEVNYYEPADYERLVAAAGKLDRLIEVTVLLGGEAGLRSGEMLGLQWGDVDFTRGVLHVRRAVWMGQVTLPKSGKGRTIPMTKRLAACLKALRHLVREEVLHRPDGGQATRATVHKWLKRAEKKAGLPPLGALHTLRHTFCSRLARQGAPAAAIQQLAGHSSYSTTARYVHLFEGAKESAIRLLEGPKFGDMLETGAEKEVEAGA